MQSVKHFKSRHIYESCRNTLVTQLTLWTANISNTKHHHLLPPNVNSMVASILLTSSSDGHGTNGMIRRPLQPTQEPPIPCADEEPLLGLHFAFSYMPSTIVKGSRIFRPAPAERLTVHQLVILSLLFCRGRKDLFIPRHVPQSFSYQVLTHT